MECDEKVKHNCFDTVILRIDVNSGLLNRCRTNEGYLFPTKSQEKGKMDIYLSHI